MAKPTVTSSDIEPRNLYTDAGRWIADFAEPVTLRFAPESSGNADPYVNLMIDWGDGNIEAPLDQHTVKRIASFIHVYESSGDFIITIQAKNTDGELSDIVGATTISVRVNQQRERNQLLPRWNGLALPVKRIGEGFEVVEDVFPVETAVVGAAATKGDTKIVVLGNGDEFEGDAPTVIISQQGKLVTSARVTGRDRNIIELDRVLKDDYDANVATVELAKRTLSRGRGTTRYIPDDWFFPASSDRDLIRAAVSMVLSTAQFERVMRPTYGSGVHRIPFEPLDEITAFDLEGEVSDAISNWEPRVSVLESKIKQNPNGNEMKLFVTLKENNRFGGEPFTLDFDLVNPAAGT